MFETVKVEAIFPTPLWIVDLKPGVHRPLNAELLEALQRLIERPPLGLGGTWQSDPVLHRRQELSGLIALLQESVRGALSFLEVDYGEFEITGCWANINPPGGLNSSHDHPNNYLSGVYYVSVPEGTGKIEFADPRAGAGTIVPPVKTWNKFTCTKVTVDVKEGRIVLFPAWLKHAVPVNRSRQERVSISFNVMFRNFTETMSRPLWSKGSAPLQPPR